MSVLVIIMSSESLPAFDHSSEWKFTQPPNPEFRFGQKVEETPEGREWLKGLESGWEVIDTSKTESVPLPVASLSSLIRNTTIQPWTYLQNHDRWYCPTSGRLRVKCVGRWGRESWIIQVRYAERLILLLIDSSDHSWFNQVCSFMSARTHSLFGIGFP